MSDDMINYIVMAFTGTMGMVLFIHALALGLLTYHAYIHWWMVPLVGIVIGIGVGQYWWCLPPVGHSVYLKNIALLG
jgi:hypothetical protein